MTDSSTIEEGDVVRLKSGGPAMKVQVRSAHLLYCIWFKGEDLKSGTFDEDLVARIDAEADDTLLKKWMARNGLSKGPGTVG
jgi:uncharacterized protein YodC (DUF2158 family)